MARLYLVRHGKAATGWDGDLDPGLDAVGRTQAAAMCEALAPLGPLPILVSPMRRTRETAAALEACWNAKALLEPTVSEIPSPTADLKERRVWLTRAMAGRWRDLGAGLTRWRQGVVDRLLAIPEDSVVVSHFIAINVAVGHALGDDRVTCFRPDNGSRTVLEVANGTLRLVSLGEEAVTEAG
jgi:broad specificity phosphatase PhoE